MTCSLFTRRILWNFIFVFCLSILFTPQLSAQSSGLKDELSNSLSGTTVISTILLGEEAAPHGYRSGYPVDTLVYPGGSQVTYRMDLGTTSTTIHVQDMQLYFDRGTSFQVSGIDLQDGWLDLKLKSAGGEYARLRLMLGSGWQSKFDSSSIRAQMACALILDQNPRPEQRPAVPVGFGDTFSQKEHEPPAKGTHAGAGSGGEVYVKSGRTS